MFSRSTDAGISLQAPCAGGAGAGRWELRGGTEKYARIAGQCTYETQYLDGGWVVVLGTCEWTRP